MLKIFPENPVKKLLFVGGYTCYLQYVSHFKCSCTVINSTAKSKINDGNGIAYFNRGSIPWLRDMSAIGTLQSAPLKPGVHWHNPFSILTPLMQFGPAVTHTYLG